MDNAKSIKMYYRTSYNDEDTTVFSRFPGPSSDGNVVKVCREYAQKLGLPYPLEGKVYKVRITAEILETITSLD